MKPRSAIVIALVDPAWSPDGRLAFTYETPDAGTEKSNLDIGGDAQAIDNPV